jgi:hypothetical protein
MGAATWMPSRSQAPAVKAEPAMCAIRPVQRASSGAEFSQATMRGKILADVPGCREAVEPQARLISPEQGVDEAIARIKQILNEWLGARQPAANSQPPRQLLATGGTLDLSPQMTRMRW